MITPEMLSKILDGKTSFRTRLNFYFSDYNFTCNKYPDSYMCYLSLYDDPEHRAMAIVSFALDHDRFDYITKKNDIAFKNIKDIIRNLYGLGNYKKIEINGFPVIKSIGDLHREN